MTNALLLAHGNSLLFYRSIDENDYREAMLVFYETNFIIPFKKIFIDQYKSACKNYAVRQRALFLICIRMVFKFLYICFKKFSINL